MSSRFPNRRPMIGALTLSLLFAVAPAFAHPGHAEPLGLLARLAHALLGTGQGLALLAAGFAAAIGMMMVRERRTRRARRAAAASKRVDKV